MARSRQERPVKTHGRSVLPNSGAVRSGGVERPVLTPHEHSRVAACTIKSGPRQELQVVPLNRESDRLAARTPQSALARSLGFSGRAPPPSYNK